jgi:hypothetical protein
MRHLEPPFHVLIVCRDVGNGAEQLVAMIDDGREFTDSSAYALAHKLHQAGVTADEVLFPHWREGDIAPGDGQKIRIFHCLRLWERGEEPLDDLTLYGPDVLT